MNGTASKNESRIEASCNPNGRRSCLVPLALALVSLTLATGCAAKRASQSFVFDGTVEDVVVDLDSGDVVVTGSDQDQTRVEVDLACRGGAPEYAVNLEGGRVNVSGRAGWAGEEACDGTVRITTPKRASLEISVSRGDVAVQGVEGEIAIETFDGDIECDARSHQVQMKTDTTAVASSAPSVVFQ